LGVYADQLAEVHKIARAVDKAFEHHRVDAIIFPSRSLGSRIAASGGFPIVSDSQSR